MNRKFLDALYEELESAKQQVADLKAVSGFHACPREGCDWRLGVEKHQAKLLAAREREARVDGFITLYVDTHGG